MYQDNNGEMVAELRRGFSQLSMDITSAMRNTDRGIQRAIGEGQGITGNIVSAKNRFVGGVVRPAAGFLSQTLSTQYNQPAHIGRDIVYGLGLRKHASDMTDRELNAYVSRNTTQRIENFGSWFRDDLMDTAAEIATFVPGLSTLGLAYQATNYVGKKAGLWEDKRKVNAWKNQLNFTSQSTIRAGKSRNMATGVGWSKGEEETLADFHMYMDRAGSFDPDTQHSIQQAASSAGYFDKSTTITEYEKDYSTLLKSISKMGKVLKTTTQDAVQILAQMKKLGVKSGEQSAMIGEVMKASKYSGESGIQVMQYAAGIAQMGKPLGMTASQGIALGTTLKRVGGENYILKNLAPMINSPEFMASFFNKAGKFDNSRYKEYMDVSGDPEKMSKFLQRGEEYISEKIKPDTVGGYENLEKMRGDFFRNTSSSKLVAMAIRTDYDKFKYQYGGKGTFGQYAAMKRKTLRGQALKDFNDFSKSVNNFGFNAAVEMDTFDAINKGNGYVSPDEGIEGFFNMSDKYSVIRKLNTLSDKWYHPNDSEAAAYLFYKEAKESGGAAGKLFGNIWGKADWLMNKKDIGRDTINKIKTYKEYRDIKENGAKREDIKLGDTEALKAWEKDMEGKSSTAKIKDLIENASSYSRWFKYKASQKLNFNAALPDFDVLKGDNEYAGKVIGLINPLLDNTKVTIEDAYVMYKESLKDGTTGLNTPMVRFAAAMTGKDSQLNEKIARPLFKSFSSIHGNIDFKEINKSDGYQEGITSVKNQIMSMYGGVYSDNEVNATVETLKALAETIGSLNLKIKGDG